MDPTTFATAYALSTSIGLRPFLTLAIAALAIHFGYLHVSPAFAFLGADGTSWLFAGLAVLEFVGDKIPAVDHVLHVLHFGVKPIAAAILVGGAVGTAADPNDAMTYVAMGAAGLNALGIHTGVTALRGASSAMTLGLANPVLSLVEDVVTVGATLLAFVAPFVGAALALAIGVFVIVVLYVLLRELRKRRAVGAMRSMSAPPAG
jgi:hypothetical protein